MVATYTVTEFIKKNHKRQSRTSLVGNDTDRSVRLVQLQLGGGRADRQKVHGIVVICAFRRSAQTRPDGPFQSNMAATLARLGVYFGQHGPNFASAQLRPTWPQLRPNSARRWRALAPKRTHLGATSAQVEVHMASKWEI